MEQMISRFSLLDNLPGAPRLQNIAPIKAPDADINPRQHIIDNAGEELQRLRD